MERNKEKYRKRIEKDLKMQLAENGTKGRHYDDLVEDYMRFWDIKNQLMEDIDARGIVTEYNNGGGQTGKKKNDSIEMLLKVSDRMTRILDKLGIKPSKEPGRGDEDDL